MKTVLLNIRASTQDQWLSCRVIEDDYQEVFLQLREKVDFSECNEEDLDSFMPEFIRQHAEEKIHVFFSSRELNIPRIMESFTKLGLCHRLHVIIPVYGNMTDRVPQWCEMEPILKGKEVSLLCSSQALLRQTQKFVAGDVCRLLPYPVSQAFFQVKGQSVPSQVKLVYAGRIALGKNVFQLIRQIRKVTRFREDIVLDIYGDFSFEGHHFHGLNVSHDELKRHFFSSLGEDGRVTYRGAVSQEELANAFADADYFISLSTYHDEDFGMAAAQAQAAGATLILSAWGGFLDFVTPVPHIPLQMGSQGFPRPMESEVMERLMSLPKNKRREQSRKDAQERFSAEAVAQKFLTLLKTPSHYEGQSILFQKYALLYSQTKSSPYRHITTEPEVFALYHELYESYGKF